MRTIEDATFLRSVPTGILEDFRNETYTEKYYLANQKKFSNTDWVDVEELKDFIRQQKERDASVSLNASCVKQEHDAPEGMLPVRDASFPSVVKLEDAPERVLDCDVPQAVLVKQEVVEYSIPTHFGNQDNHDARSLRTVFEDGKEITLISDSESEAEEVDNVVKESFPSSDTLVPDGPALETTLSDLEADVNDSSDIEMHGWSDDELDPGLRPPTTWLDTHITSIISHGPHQLHRQLKVDSIEYLSELPSYIPIPSTKVAFLIDLSDPKFDIRDKDGKLLSVDALVKNSDQDSWRGSTGAADSRTMLSIFTGELIPCRRSRLQCAGSSVCKRINHELLGERRELDPQSLQKVVQAQIASRVREADTPEKHALIFFIICHSAPCSAVNPQNDQLCTGVPTLRHFRDGKTQKGKSSFISCTGYSGSFPHGHRTASIPANVRESDLKILFSGGSLRGFETPPRCSRIVSAHIGGKLKACRYVHSGDGKQYEMVEHECKAQRVIYVPDDPTIRKCLIIHKGDRDSDDPFPHNHPILPAVKASRIIQDLYTACIVANGVVGSTVHKVDNAKTTEMILNKKIPAVVAPALQNTRLKSNLIQRTKNDLIPGGEGLGGVFLLKKKEDSKPVAERYVHAALELSDGRALVVTANPYLLKLVHQAKMIQVDTTFKRCASDLDEWEVVMWEEATKRAITIARVYSNRADRFQFKLLFDEFRRVIHTVTGKPLLLKRLSQKGTLLAIGADLELAQALGAGDSFAETNEPEYSGIPATAPVELLLAYFIKACLGHAKRGVLALKGLLTNEQFKRIMEFFYLETPEAVEEFSEWVKDLGIKKVTDWWNHKTVNKWILPALIKCMSKIDPDDWDLLPATTNLNEGQHHNTNVNTGTGLTLLNAVLTARTLDAKVAAQIEASLESGVMKSNQNDTFSRMLNNLARTNNASRKAREVQEQNEALQHVKENIDELAQAQRENAARLKALKATKAEMTSRKPRTSRRAKAKAESSSSGRVYGDMPEQRAKEAAKVSKKKTEIRSVTATKTQVEGVTVGTMRSGDDAAEYSEKSIESQAPASVSASHGGHTLDVAQAMDVDALGARDFNPSFVTSVASVPFIPSEPFFDVTSSTNLFGQDQFSQGFSMDTAASFQESGYLEPAECSYMPVGPPPMVSMTPFAPTTYPAYPPGSFLHMLLGDN